MLCDWEHITNIQWGFSNLTTEVEIRFKRDVTTTVVDPLIIGHMEQMAVALYFSCDGLL